MVKEALDAAGPFTFLAVRFCIAALVMLPFLARLSPSARARGGKLALQGGLVLGVVGFAGYGFQTVGLQFTTAARAAFVTGTSVVLVPVISALFLRKAIPGPAWLGVLLAVSGMALLSLGPDVLAGGELFSHATLAGDLLVFVCAVAFAVHIVLVGELANRIDVVALTTWQLVGSALLGIVFALALERPAMSQLPVILPAALFTGVFATAAAFLLQIRAQRATTATHTALIFSTEPIFGALFAYLLVGEVLGAGALVGCVLILAGMVIAHRSPG